MHGPLLTCDSFWLTLALGRPSLNISPLTRPRPKSTEVRIFKWPSENDRVLLVVFKPVNLAFILFGRQDKFLSSFFANNFADIGDWTSITTILVTTLYWWRYAGDSFYILVAESVTNISNLSPTKATSNIRHQHRCNQNVYRIKI